MEAPGSRGPPGPGLLGLVSRGPPQLMPHYSLPFHLPPGGPGVPAERRAPSAWLIPHTRGGRGPLWGPPVPLPGQWGGTCFSLFWTPEQCSEEMLALQTTENPEAGVAWLWIPASPVHLDVRPGQAPEPLWASAASFGTQPTSKVKIAAQKSIL